MSNSKKFHKIRDFYEKIHTVTIFYIGLIFLADCVRMKNIRKRDFL